MNEKELNDLLDSLRDEASDCVEAVLGGNKDKRMAYEVTDSLYSVVLGFQKRCGYERKEGGAR